MEMALGLKLTRAADDFTSDLQIVKDRAGPLFLSRETGAFFILTAHLKGYHRGNLKIDINENGTLITISGEKRVKETVIVGYKVIKKDTEIKGFKKIFKIPDGVILDKIEASFNDEESTLKVKMPKKVKGVRGTGIEEIKEKHELVKQGSSSLQIEDEKENSQIAGTSHCNNDVKTDDDDDHIESGTERADEEKQVEKCVFDDQNDVRDLENEEMKNQSTDNENYVREEEKPEGAFAGEVQSEENESRAKRCKMCIPIVAGSTLLLSFVVFVFHIIRSRNQNRRD